MRDGIARPSFVLRAESVGSRWPIEALPNDFRRRDPAAPEPNGPVSASIVAGEGIAEAAVASPRSTSNPQTGS